MSMEKYNGAEIAPQTKSLEQNLNDHVWVKVTSEGERVRDEYFNGLGMETPLLEKNSEGWTEMQLHEVFLLFGTEMYNGNFRLPIEPTFRVGTLDKEDPNAVRNLNDKVLVKITPAGEQIRNNYFAGIKMDTPAIERDSEGWTEMQLYEVANLFGAEMYNGNPRLPIEPTFRVEAPEKL
jgi:hypothetical protein